MDFILWLGHTCEFVGKSSDSCRSRHVLGLFALFGSLWLDPAATEGGAVSDLFAFLLRWRSTHGVWTIAAGVHPPAGRNQRTRKRESLCWNSVLSGCQRVGKVDKGRDELATSGCHLTFQRAPVGLTFFGSEKTWLILNGLPWSLPHTFMSAQDELSNFFLRDSSLMGYFLLPLPRPFRRQVAGKTLWLILSSHCQQSKYWIYFFYKLHTFQWLWQFFSQENKEENELCFPSLPQHKIWRGCSKIRRKH